MKKLFTKSTLLALGGLVGIALVAMVGSRVLGSGSAQVPEVAVNTTGGVMPSPTFTVGGYLPTWLSDAEYARISETEGVDKLYVAFATVDTAGNVIMPKLSPAAISAISTLGAKAQKTDQESQMGGVYLSVGGWGANQQQHDDMLKGFSAGLDQPDAFAAKLKTSVTELQTATKLEKIHLDLDIEFPTPAMAAKLPALVDSLRQAGLKDVVMAVAAYGKEAEGVQSVAHDLAAKGVHFNVMTYDMTGLASAKAGPIATTPWAAATIAKWAQTTGDETKLSVGFPTYCYTFVGATKSGDRFDASASAAQHRFFKDLPPEAIVEDDAAGTTAALLSDGYTTCVSPKRATATLNAVLHNHSSIGGSFAWDLRGMTDEYAAALSGKK